MDGQRSKKNQEDEIDLAESRSFGMESHKKYESE